MSLHEERNATVRIRLRDAVTDIGHGDIVAGMDRFVDHALWVAEQLDLRIWKAPDRHRVKYQALYSLRTILGYNACHAQEGWKNPATNHGWVLSVWEAALDDWTRVNPVTPRYAQTADAEPEAALERPTSLSTRILDAYVRRDDALMITTLAELEALGH